MGVPVSPGEGPCNRTMTAPGRKILLWVAAGLAVAAALAVILFFGLTDHQPVYSVAITGITGLDPTLDLRNYDRRATLSPVFNLTVHIKNRHNTDTACMSSYLDIVVSYDNRLMVLAKGTAPSFCAKPKREKEGGTTAWGTSVEMPRFLRDRLASELEGGQAVFDVELVDDFWNNSYACKVKIGGDLCRC